MADAIAITGGDSLAVSRRRSLLPAELRERGDARLGRSVLQTVGWIVDPFH